MPNSDDSGIPWWAAGLGAFALGRLTAPDRTPRKLLERGGVAYLRQVVQEWRPLNCENEADCQLALHNYLLGRFSQDRLFVDAEYGAAQSRADIVVENSYAIEIKYALDGENEIKRLIGQVQELRSRFKGVLAVLCGPMSEDAVNRLNRVLYLEDPSNQYVRSAVIHVEIVRPKKRVRRERNSKRLAPESLPEQSDE